MVGPEGWLRWLAHPFGHVEGRGHGQYPAYVPSSSEAAVGWLCFGLVFFVSCPESVPIVHARSCF